MGTRTRTTFHLLYLGKDTCGILHVVPVPPRRSLCGDPFAELAGLRSEGTPSCMDCLAEEASGK